MICKATKVTTSPDSSFIYIVNDKIRDLIIDSTLLITWIGFSEDFSKPGGYEEEMATVEINLSRDRRLVHIVNIGESFLIEIKATEGNEAIVLHVSMSNMWALREDIRTEMDNIMKEEKKDWKEQLYDEIEKQAKTIDDIDYNEVKVRIEKYNKMKGNKSSNF